MKYLDFIQVNMINLAAICSVWLLQQFATFYDMLYLAVLPMKIIMCALVIVYDVMKIYEWLQKRKKT
jgi:hypothetical protein